MSIEAGAVIDLDGNVIYWHLPPGRSIASLPDSRDLWEVFWENRANISGFVHSHPGSGPTQPSWTDVTTFSAVELGLGKKLKWWIITQTETVLCGWTGPGKYDYHVETVPEDGFVWIEDLRKHSYS